MNSKPYSSFATAARLGLPARVEPPRTVFLTSYLLFFLLLVGTAFSVMETIGSRIQQPITSVHDALWCFLAAGLMEGRRWIRVSFLALGAISIWLLYMAAFEGFDIGDRSVLAALFIIVATVLMARSARQWFSFCRSVKTSAPLWTKHASLHVCLAWYVAATSMFLAALGEAVITFYAPGVQVQRMASTIALLLFAGGYLLNARRVSSLRALTRVNFDSNPLVLYLRQFTMDEHTGGTALSPKLLPMAYEEDRLASAVAHLGVLVAVAKPEDKLPTLGALKVKAAQADWPSVVQYLLSRSRFVILLAPVTLTPGIEWEIREIRSRVPDRRILLAIPNSKIALSFVDKQFPIYRHAPLDAAHEALRVGRDRKKVIGILGVDFTGEPFFAPLDSYPLLRPWSNSLRETLRSKLPGAAPSAQGAT